MIVSVGTHREVHQQCFVEHDNGTNDLSSSRLGIFVWEEKIHTSHGLYAIVRGITFIIVVL